MRLLRRLTGAFRAVVSRARIERELDDELRQFFDAAVDAKLESGMSRADAERSARLELGSPAAVKDWVRDVGWESRLESVWQDVRYALRTLRRSPGFAFAAIGTLAVGLGSTAAMYAVVDAVLLKPFPFDSPDRVVEIQWRGQARGNYGASGGAIAAVRQLRAVEYAAGTRGTERAIAAGDVSMLASGEAATEEFFQVFGVPAALGRTFSAADRHVGAVVVLSDRLWKRLGARADVIGQTILMSGVPHHVLGVMPQDFRIGPGLEGDYWILRPFQPSELAQEGAGPFHAIVRLRTSELAAARAQIAGLNLPPARTDDGEPLSLTIVPILDTVEEFYGGILWPLLGAVAFVLLLACGNVANLLLARARQRGPELVVRAAIGASRGRLLRQVLTECVVLAGIAAAFGCGLAWLLVHALPLLPLTTTNVARIDEVAITTRVYAFMVGLTLAAVLIFGTIPALMASGRHAIVRSGRAFTARGGKATHALIAAEIAATVALLAGTGLVALRVADIITTDIGFDLRGLHIASLRPVGGATTRAHD